MEANDFLNMMACLREEVEKFCRSSQVTRGKLASLGWAMTWRYWHHSFSPAMSRVIATFVIKYGEGKVK